MITIYHHPQCSKSRAALQLVQQFSTEHNLALQVIDYQKTPLLLPQLISLQLQLGNSVAEMVRENEEEYINLNLSLADDARLLQALADHPKLLQRPIVVYDSRAKIGRPPEILRDFLLKIG